MILVTGAAGYIGSHFLKTVLDLTSDDVVAIDDLSEGHRQAIVDSPHVAFVEANIGDLKKLRKVFVDYKIDVVVHFAGSISVGESQTNPTKYLHNNVTNTLNLLKAMEESNIKHFLFSSSCAVYGIPQWLPLTEEHPYSPINVYGQTKYMIEQTLSELVKNKGFSSFVLRYFNVAGADKEGLLGESHDPETHLIPLALACAAGRLKALEIYGTDYDTADGTAIRDYIDVNDLALAHCLALTKLRETIGLEAINLGTTTGTSVQEVVDLCSQVTGHSIKLKFCPRRPGDAPRLVADNAKAKRLLGWQPHTSLEETIQSAWLWEQNRRY